MSKYIWALPEGVFANMVRGIYDEQTQATLVDRTVTKIAKAMSLQPPTVVVTPPLPERSSPKLESHVMKESERLHKAESAMTTDCTAPEWYYATPAGLLDLTLMQEDLEQRSLDGRPHWEEKREENKRNFPKLFNTEALETATVKPPSQLKTDSAAGLHQAEMESKERTSQGIDRERKFDDREVLEEEYKRLNDSEQLAHASWLERKVGSKPATGSESARKEGSSPQSLEMVRKADGGMAAVKSREDDDWVKVKAPLKSPTREEDWELLDADQSEEEWTLV